MAEQIFISYRRDGGDVTAKLICESLKSRGYTVFYDYDSIQGGYFDERITKAIETCADFILVLPEGGLDRCQNADDWVRQEIVYALQHDKNIIPVMMSGFTFPKNLPEDIAMLPRINGVEFVMAYYEAVIGTIVERLTALIASKGLEFTLNADRTSYTVSRGSCTDAHVVIPKFHQDKPVTTIKQRAFYKCSFLTKVTIPDSVVCIDYSAFSGCTSLTSVTIPKSIFHPGPLSAFLTEQNLPHSIGDHSFAGCSSLTDIRYEGTIDQWATTIDSTNSAFSGVPAKFVECADGRSNDLSSFGDRIVSAFAIPRKK